MEQGIAALTYAVRPRAVGHYLGQLFVVLAALTVAPLLVSLWYGEYAFTWRLGAVIAVLLLTGWPLMRLPTPPHIQANEALVLVALTFIIASALRPSPHLSVSARVDAVVRRVGDCGAVARPADGPPHGRAPARRTGRR
ncbi:MAG: hypothetical protein P8009_07815 [Gammaproteobacteria bacterium]